MQLGDVLYKYVTTFGIFQYVVIGVYQGDGLVVECQNCNHPEKCKVIVKPDGCGAYVFEAMANDSGAEHDFLHRVYDDYDRYFKSRDLCNRALRLYQIEKQREIVLNLNNAIKDANEKMDALKSELLGAEKRISDAQ